MKVSVLIPCHNEEKSIRQCVESCLYQTRKPDQILVVNDGSTDRSGEILASFGDAIEVLTIPQATGNKSYAQERGLAHITGDIFLATDGDTILEKDCIKEAIKAFEDQTDIVAACGYVKSTQYNWLTACREIDYVIGQNLFKLAQAYLDAIFVIPGCVGAFRTSIFKKVCTFDHDTITEDLDFTYKFHKLGLRIVYAKKMIAYTQDPDTLSSYINQIRRWYAGGWQNLSKHFSIVKRPNNVFQLSLNYIEGLVFSMLFFIAHIINIKFAVYFFIPFFIFIVGMGAISAIVRKRIDLFLYSPTYIILVYINTYVFLEQFVKQVILKRKTLIWFQPERREMFEAPSGHTFHLGRSVQ